MATIPEDFNLAFQHHQAGRLPEAEALYRQILQAHPDHSDALHLLGVIAHQAGKHDVAVEHITRAIALNPADAEYHNNIGEAYRAMGKCEEAVAHYRQALALKPGYAEAYYNLGIVLHTRGNLEEALAQYRQALTLKPAYSEAYNNLGNVLKDQGKLEDAVIVYRQALALMPACVETYNNLGVALMRQGKLEDAVAAYRQALALMPACVETYNNLGLALQDQGKHEEATVCYRRALAIRPNFVMAHSNLLFALNYHPDKSGDEIYAAYREYDARFGLPHRSQWRSHCNSRDAMRCLKVGYVSPDFYTHSVCHFLEPLLAHHDKGMVEVYAYAEWICEDAVTERYKRYVDRWAPTRGLPDDALAEHIRADGIDILVDLAGHTERHRLGVFARKPAPVSVSWLGYGYTTGLTAIDYFLTDAVCAPPGSEPLFAEVPWRLATPGYAYRPAEGMGDSNSLPALAKGFVTFGTLSRSVRINHRTIRVWAEILKRVRGSRLVVESHEFCEVAMQTALAETFAAHGIGREQLEIGGHSPPWEVLRNMDIGLDCFPHNSGTTLCETLYIGVPFVTLQGRPSVGRLGSSILEGVGHPEWIARTEDEYVEIAVALAADLTKLSALRAGLRNEMKTSPLMDEPGFACKVEAAYREMWTRWCGR